MPYEEELERVLLLVDDEENILSSLTRLFRRDGYTILQASSGEEGIKILKEHPVGVIVSDQRMPEMTGVEFLSKVKDIYPDTIRIILSGYTDLKSVTDSINEGSIYKFFTKPWDDVLLKKNVAEAFERHELKLKNIWLTDKLRQANESLEEMNKVLNQNIVKKTEEADLSTFVLSISQEMLENMPAGIIGIGDDGLIVITNKLSEQWLAKDGNSVIGQMAKDALPEKVYSLYQYVSKNHDEKFESLTLENGMSLEIRCSALGIKSEARGTVLVLTETM